MSQNLPNMLESTIEKIRDMVKANTVVGDPITVENTTLIPISKISIGLGGGGFDLTSKKDARQDDPFGGGVAAGVKVTPVAFLVIKGGNVRMLPVAAPANTTADRVVEMIPDTLDKIATFIDSKLEKKAE